MKFARKNIHYINDKIPKKFANGGLKLLRYIDVIFKFCCTYITLSISSNSNID